jgi:hypothetical protein
MATAPEMDQGFKTNACAGKNLLDDGIELTENLSLTAAFLMRAALPMK